MEETMYGAPDDVVWSDKSHAMREEEEKGDEDDPNKVQNVLLDSTTGKCPPSNHGHSRHAFFFMRGNYLVFFAWCRSDEIKRPQSF